MSEIIEGTFPENPPNRLQEWLSLKGMTQKELAHQMDTEPSNVCRWSAGRGLSFGPGGNAEKVANALGILETDLLRDEQDASNSKLLVGLMKRQTEKQNEEITDLKRQNRNLRSVIQDLLMDNNDLNDC